MMMQKHVLSADNKTLKVIHPDLSETAIKQLGSCNQVNRKKYSIFASSSSGCCMKCGFCGLTNSNMKYTKLSEEQIITNLQEAIRLQIGIDPTIIDNYIKICWMGMGEDHILNPTKTNNISIKILNYILDNGYAMGLDGIDIASTIPKTGTKWVNEFIQLNGKLSTYILNPNNRFMVNTDNHGIYVSRSPLRFFYSLHSALEQTRAKIIPNSSPIQESIKSLDALMVANINVIFHHMFLSDVNDSDEEIEALIHFMSNYPDNELRVLRYNHNGNSPYTESDRLDEILDTLEKNNIKIKKQISSGSDIKAACGQFIMAKTA